MLWSPACGSHFPHSPCGGVFCSKPDGFWRDGRPAGKSRNGKLPILTSTKLTVSNVHPLTAVTDHIVIKKDAALVLFFVWKKKKGL